MSNTLHFGPDVPLRHIYQVLLEEQGTVVGRRGTGKTTALIEYVAMRSVKLKKHIGILCHDSKIADHTKLLFYHKYGRGFQFEPCFTPDPEQLRGIAEVYIDEPWDLDLQRLKWLRQLPIYGAIGTPDILKSRDDHPGRITDLSFDPETGIDHGPWAMANRW